MPSKQPRTLADFRAAHDPDVIIPSRIREAFAAMLKIGPQHYEYEVDFLKLSGLSTTQLAAYRDQFAAHIIETPSGRNGAAKRVYFASAKVAASLRPKE